MNNFKFPSLNLSNSPTNQQKFIQYMVGLTMGVVLLRILKGLMGGGGHHRGDYMAYNRPGYGDRQETYYNPMEDRE